jgi:ubiquinone/menaquinone biosynthesis C-methylase UbiE
MRTLEEKLALPITKLDLGCGLNRHEKEKDEYIYLDGDPAEGIDIVCNWDKIPLPDKSIDYVHSSETIEHIPQYHTHIVLPEWNRVMKVGATLELTTPNLDYVCRAWAFGEKDYEWTIRNLYGDRHSAHHNHYILYNKDTLTEVLAKYGFGEFNFKSIGHTDPKEWWWLAMTCKKVKDI